MQCKADLPKHFKTSLHANDPRIPKPGTPEWDNLINQSQVTECPTKSKENSSTQDDSDMNEIQYVDIVGKSISSKSTQNGKLDNENSGDKISDDKQ